jgi:hypothetical protein
VLSALAAILFLYLALIPGGLIVFTLDSACAGEACETSVPAGVVLTVLYGLCLVALLAAAALFAGHARRMTVASQERLVRFLPVVGAVVGVTLYALFLVASPLYALVALALAVAAYVALRLRRGGGRGADVSGNGSLSTNGRGGDRLPPGPIAGRAPRR